MAIKKKIVKKSVKKPVKNKPVARKSVKKAPAKKRANKKTAISKSKLKVTVIGIITHYFPKVRAAVIKLKAPLAVGETIKIKGHTTDFTQNVSSIQLEHSTLKEAKKGQEIGLLVNSRVRQHDLVYKA